MSKLTDSISKLEYENETLRNINGEILAILQINLQRDEILFRKPEGKSCFIELMAYWKSKLINES